MKYKISDKFSLITFFFDRIRITAGDSTCPLYQKCPNRDEDNDCCVTFRGRTEIGGDRAPCYFPSKRRIRDGEKENKIGIFGHIVNLLVSIGGERENKDTE